MKHTKSHLPLLVLACAVTVFVAAVYMYMYHEVNISVAKSSAAEQAVIASQVDKSRAQEFMLTYQTAKPDLDRLTGFFVPSANAVAFIEAIEELGTATGATTSISTIQADNLDTSAPGTTGTVSARVSASGTWTQVMRVLQLAELLPYQTVVSDTSLSVDEAGSSARRQWNLSFAIKALMLVPFGTTTSTSTGTPTGTSTSSSSAH